MKIVSWNCCMGFRNKAHMVLALTPDILIIQECESFGKFDFSLFPTQPTSMHWCQYKDGKKGLAIFSFGEFRFAVHEAYTAAFSVIVPVVVSTNTEQFNLIAVWTVNTGEKDGHYIDQIWKAIDHYENFVLATKTILIGDFNSNVIFDRKGKEATHTNLVAKLEKKGIVSAYHSKEGQVQGSETHSTFYLYRHKEKPFHIDHCFVSSDFLARLSSIEVGGFEEWVQHSDHVPLIVTFEN